MAGSLLNAAASHSAGAMNAVMARAYIQPKHPKSRIPLGLPLVCAFNPSQLTIGQTSDWVPSNVPRANVAARPQFRSTQPRTMNIELFFDRSTIRPAQVAASAMSGSAPGPSVEGDIERLMDMTRPVDGTDPPTPPQVTFGWGQMKAFTGFIKSVQATYLLFGRAGYPYRAKARVDFGQIQQPLGRQNPTSGAERARKTHRIGPGDTLQSVAYAAYGDPRFWRGLAVFNEVDDPLRLRIGDEILLPEEEEVAEVS